LDLPVKYAINNAINRALYPQKKGNPEKGLPADRNSGVSPYLIQLQSLAFINALLLEFNNSK